MKKAIPIEGQSGQGLIEYVLLMVLVVLVVMAGLIMFGPAVGNMFRSASNGLAYGTPGPAGNTAAPGSTAAPTATATSIAGSIRGVSAQRTNGGKGNSVTVTVTVSAATTLTLVASEGETRLANVPCSGTCVVTMPDIGHDQGYIAITSAAGGLATVRYPEIVESGG